jgi:prepilin-type processing-associated H-X9-DG protein
MYANENKGKYPRTTNFPGMALTDAAPPFVQQGAGAASPFGGLLGFVGTNNVPAAMFLLIRTQGVTPEVFICPSANNVGRDDFGGGSNSAQTRSNFSKLPDNLSYSYANPYPDDPVAAAGYILSTARTGAEFAVAADLNPGKQGSFDVTLPMETSSATTMQKANSSNHNQQGENVLYGDGHVEFVQNPFAGTRRDNIYTVSGSTDGSITTSATIVGSPKWAGDSVLLPALGK